MTLYNTVKLVFYFPVLLYLMALLRFVRALGQKSVREIESDRFSLITYLFLKLTTELLTVNDELSTEINKCFGADDMIKIQLNTVQKTNYTPPTEREKDNPVTFEMHRLSRARLAKIRDRLLALKKGRVDGIRNLSVAYETVVEMIMGWENISDENGEAIPFKKLKVREIYEALPTEMQDDLEAKFGTGSIDWEAAEEKEAEAKAKEDNDEDSEEDESSDEEDE
jgi:hypothetical protein